MIMTVGNFLTLGIVVVLFALYHQLTKDNRSADKLKRIGERMKEDLDSHVDRRSEDLRNYGIELDVQQKAAKIALDKLHVVQESITAHAAAMAQIAEKLATYDTVLARLMEMTARVEENLGHVQEESAFADSVNRRVEAARKSLEAVERELPLIREDFAAEAERSVARFRDSVVAELKENMDSTKATLAAARDESMSAVARAEAAGPEIDAVFRAALEAARTEAVTLEDAAFAKLKENSDAKATRLQTALEERFGALGAEAGALAREVREGIAALRAQWAAEAEELIGNARAEIRGAAAELESRLETVKAAALEAGAEAADARMAAESAVATARGELADLGAAVEGRAESLGAILADDSARIIDRARQEFDARAGALEADTAGRIAALEESGRKFDAMHAALRNSMEEAERRLEDEFAAFGQAFEDHRTRFEEGFAGETGRLRASVAAIASEVDSLKEKAWVGMSGKLSEFEGEIFASLAAKESDLRERLDQEAANLGRRIDAMAEEAVRSRAETERGYSEELRSRLAERVLAGEKELKEAVAAVSAGMAAQRAKLDDSLEALGKELAAMRERSMNALAEAEGQFHSELESFSAAASNLVERARNEYENQRDAFERASLADRDRISADIIALSEKVTEIDQAVSARIVEEADRSKG